MFKQIANRKTIGLAVCYVLCGAAQSFAQWGENAPVYQCGECVPLRKSWGYCQTQWNRWPGAVYPDMIPPPAVGEEIPPPSLDVPPPSREADVRAPSPSRPTFEAAPGTGGGGAGGGAGGASMPAESSRPEPAARAPSRESAPGLLPEPATGAVSEPTLPAPVLADPDTGASTSGRLPPLTAPPRNRQASTTTHPTRLSLNKAIEEPPSSEARVRTAGGGYIRPVQNKAEPELIAPALNMRPLDGGPQKPRSWRPAAGNPFRPQYVLPAGHSDEASTGNSKPGEEEARVEDTTAANMRRG